MNGLSKVCRHRAASRGNVFFVWQLPPFVVHSLSLNGGTDISGLQD